jgi:16S rRNA (guanine527-N7)-methyltransferase
VRYGIDDAGRRTLQTLAGLIATDDAPTTVTDAGAILRDHLADSLVALELGQVRAAVAVADLGSGAGFPGLPLAIALPTASCTLIDGNHRKCEFMRAAADRCGIENVTVTHARAEEWNPEPGGCDLVVARALAPLGVIAEYAAPLLRVGGALVAWRGRRDAEDEAVAARAAAILGLRCEEPIAVTPYPGALHRHLHVVTKVVPTPDRFPRRPGMARKRPLGARATGTAGPI